MIKIGVSPRLLHPQPGARGVHTRVLHYLEDWGPALAELCSGSLRDNPIEMLDLYKAGKP